MKFLIAWFYFFICCEREREKCLEAKKMKENENPETLKRLRVFFFFNGKGHVEFGYIVFRLNGSQWVFS